MHYLQYVRNYVAIIIIIILILKQNNILLLSLLFFTCDWICKNVPIVHAHIHFFNFEYS